MDKKKIGKFLADLRKENELTQKDLAERLYVERATVSKWETGDYIPISYDLLKLSEIFNVSINEILAGERKTKDNEKFINNVTLEVIKDGNKRVKKVVITFLSIFILFIILFLTYYFINNYNSISVYKINGESENFCIQDGIMIISREKAYIKLNEVKSSSENIENIRLYYKDNDDEIDIYCNKDTNELLVNIFGYNELFSYNNFSVLKDNLYLEIQFNDTKETMKLDVVKDFSNNSIFNKNSSIIQNDEKADNNNDIPEYFKNNFNYDSEERIYYLNNELNNKSINYKYLIDSEMFMIEEKKNNHVEQWVYSFKDCYLTYSDISEDKIDNTFSYDYSKKSCIYGNCSIDKIEYFENEYFSQIE